MLSLNNLAYRESLGGDEDSTSLDFAFREIKPLPETFKVSFEREQSNEYAAILTHVAWNAADAAKLSFLSSQI